MSRILRIGSTLVVAALWGCGSYPLPKVYVLGHPASPAPSLGPSGAKPVFELKTVVVPDYLDTADIIRRAGPNQIVASSSGRWAERLSSGVTRALAAALSTRLTDAVVETRPAEAVSRRIFVDVERFDVEADGRCVLVARWWIAPDRRPPRLTGEERFIEATTSPTDAAAAAAFTRATDRLADQIAATVEQAVNVGSR